LWKYFTSPVECFLRTNYMYFMLQGAQWVEPFTLQLKDLNPGRGTHGSQPRAR